MLSLCNLVTPFTLGGTTPFQNVRFVSYIFFYCATDGWLSVLMSAEWRTPLDCTPFKKKPLNIKT